jgi:hypothetical protein
VDYFPVNSDGGKYFHSFFVPSLFGEMKTEATRRR